MLPYPISPTDVHQYEDQLQMNINVFLFVDDEDRARHPMVISRKYYKRVTNLLYWKDQYAPITNIHCLFKDITKYKQQLQFSPWCLGHFLSEKGFARHTQLCT